MGTNVGNEKGAGFKSALTLWCERGDSNPHGFTRQILSLVRLPIPPLSQDPDTVYSLLELRRRVHAERTGDELGLRCGEPAFREMENLAALGAERGSLAFGPDEKFGSHARERNPHHVRGCVRN